ncbi:MAG: hypothetical protein A3F13_06065 [Gammaproteobacteria bacterium RIFCSPHIGHO2_12_FULL_40_19]|nr:MAG: hypothetical protein A3F13_06065 [Gammaproteobacteria bacterium RIFCSPHIGHO2_12_FULL_40_19]
MADFDLSKLKGNVGGIMGSLKSMISPAGGTPNVDPDDALGLKVAQITTLTKQLIDAQQEHVKNLSKLNELLNGLFHDVQTLREEVHGVREKKAAVTPSPSPSVEKPVATPVEVAPSEPSSSQVDEVKAVKPEKKAE